MGRNPGALEAAVERYGNPPREELAPGVPGDVSHGRGLHAGEHVPLSTGVGRLRGGPLRGVMRGSPRVAQEPPRLAWLPRGVLQGLRFRKRKAMSPTSGQGYDGLCYEHYMEGMTSGEE